MLGTLFGRRLGPRSTLAWRVFALSLVMIYVQSPQLPTLLRAGEVSASALLLFAVAALLLLFGPRLALLLAVALLAGWNFVPLTLRYGTFLGSEQQAEEFLHYVALPLFALVLAAICATRGWRAAGQPAVAWSREWDLANTALFRIALVTTMALVALHKVNADFLFEPSVSCLTLMSWFPAYWELDLSPVLGGLRPEHVIAGEASLALLLPLYPSLGLLAALLVMVPIAHIGPIALNILIFALALSCLREGDVALLAQRLRARRGWVAALALAVPAATSLVYRGPRPVAAYALYHASLVVLGFAVCALLARDARALRDRWRQGGALAALRPANYRDGAASRVSAPVKLALALLAAAFVFNGLTPYLGLKFAHSFAMLSNLRTDEERWNHLIIPEWLRLSRQTPYVTVHAVEYTTRPPAEPDRLRAGLYAPFELARLVSLASARGHDARIALSFRGAGDAFESLDDYRLVRWLEALPEHRLFAKRRTLGRPQNCIH